VTIKYLLDTNIVSAPIAKVPNTELMSRLERDGHACAIPSVVWHEALYGALRLQPSKRRDMILDYLHDVVRASFALLDYDVRAAQWHAEQRSRLEAVGLAPPFVDGMIAAIAATHGLTLVSANIKDFRSFTDLVLEDWTTKAPAGR
jgi:tRNA(fMet)-specific endonuclease VapC